MPASLITRTHFNDDDGSGTTGTINNESQLQALFDEIDLLFSGTGGYTAFVFGGSASAIGGITGLLLAPSIKNYTEPFTAPSIVSVAKTISANTLANPSVVQTSTAHGWATGDYVTIAGSNSTPSINGVRQITVIDATHFSVAVNVTIAGTAGTATRNTLTLDLSTGAEFDVALTADISQFLITNVPAAAPSVTTFTIRFTADGTPRAINWATAAAVMRWGGNAPPTMTSTNTKVDTITARTWNNGGAWFPAVYDQNA